MSIIEKNILENRFKDEQLKSYDKYISYKKPRSLNEQFKILRDLFPKELHKATFDKSILKQKLPKGAEGYGLIPNQLLFGDTYQASCKKMLDLFRRNQNGHLEYDEAFIDFSKITRTKKTIECLNEIIYKQKGHDLLVVPINFGIRYRGYSVRRARVVMKENEFGLGFFEISILLFTHPHRLQHQNDLGVDCAGDECVVFGESVRGTLNFYRFRRNIMLNAIYKNRTVEFNGSATGFVQ